MTTNFPEFTVALKMARKTGSLHSDVEHRTFTVHGPAIDAEKAEDIAYGLGQGINDATGHEWKFCGDGDAIVVQPAAAEQTELDKLRAQVADLADKLHKADAEIASHTKAATAWANENQRLRDRLFADKPVIDAALAWAETVEDDTPGDFLKATDALHDAVESYRVMDMALDAARVEAEVAR